MSRLLVGLLIIIINIQPIKMSCEVSFKYNETCELCKNEVSLKDIETCELCEEMACGISCHGDPDLLYCTAMRNQVTLNITSETFPKNFRVIHIDHVDEVNIEADAILSMTSLRNLIFTKIHNLTLQHSSMARTNESVPINIQIYNVKNLEMHNWTFMSKNSNSNITIENVDEYHMSERDNTNVRIDNVDNCHMSEQTIAPFIHIRDFTLTGIDNLIIDHDAFASNIFIKLLYIMDSRYTMIQSGAFAHNSVIQKMSINVVDSLQIESDGIMADIDELKIKYVTMETCENISFSGTIRSMSIILSKIDLMKSGCISSINRLESLYITRSKVKHIEPSAIHGKIEQVQIEYSKIGIVETGGLTLNVTNFLVEKSTIGEVYEKAIDVSASKKIELIQCKLNILRKHALVMLHLDHDSNNSLKLEYILIQQADNQSLKFDPITTPVVMDMKFNTSCTCDMTRLLPEDYINDIEKSLWFGQTRCVSNYTTLTLSEYNKKNCMNQTTNIIWLSQIDSDQAVFSPRVILDFPQRSTSNSVTIIVGTITTTFLLLVTGIVVSLLVRKRFTSVRNYAVRPNYHPLKDMYV
jgi:hypothetical protein